MYVLVLPVSGGGFPCQLAILQHLCESKLTPNLTLASSGGNVAAYVAAAAKWKWSNIERISRDLSDKLFLSRWNSISSIAVGIGYFKGDVYNRGTGVSEFLGKYFTKETITNYEIWTGTYNKNKQKARLFCNRSKETSIIDTSCIDHDLTQSMEPLYLDGDIDSISAVSIASASIPAIVPSQIIEKEHYVDGGVAGASPLVVMQEPIIKYITESHSPLHIIYVNSIDLSTPNSSKCKNVLDTWKQATNDLVRSQTVNDRLAAYELLRCQSGKIHKTEFVCNYDNMERIKQLQHIIRFSMLEIYPVVTEEVNIASFSGAEVINIIKNVYNNCKCRLWWLSSYDMNMNEINNILDQCVNYQDHRNHVEVV